MSTKSTKSTPPWLYAILAFLYGSSMLAIAMSIVKSDNGHNGLKNTKWRSPNGKIVFAFDANGLTEINYLLSEVQPIIVTAEPRSIGFVTTSAATSVVAQIRWLCDSATGECKSSSWKSDDTLPGYSVTRTHTWFEFLYGTECTGSTKAVLTNYEEHPSTEDAEDLLQLLSTSEVLNYIVRRNETLHYQFDVFC